MTENQRSRRIVTTRIVPPGVPGQTGLNVQLLVVEVKSQDRGIVCLIMAKLGVIILVVLANLTRQWSVTRLHVLFGLHGVTGQSAAPRAGAECS